MWRKLLIIHMLLLTVPAFAHTYGARMDAAEWHLEPSPLHCKLWQSVPEYGDAVFEISAGKPLQFRIDAYRPVLKGGIAKMAIEAPEWRTDVEARPLGNTKVTPGRHPIHLDQDLANTLLAQLSIGLYPSFTHDDWNTDHEITVDVSPVNFQSAYSGYVSCVAGLYPADYDQVQHSLLHFAHDKWHIQGKLKQRLDLVAGYVLVDSTIDKVLVAGYTDSDGRRGYNWELSRRRAKAVKDYLIAKGIDKDMIKMTYYGETRPAKPNKTEAGKAANRRVVLQLERG